MARQPSAGEVAWGLAALDAGYPVTILTAILLASDEAVARQGTGGAWIGFLYRTISGTIPDAATVDFWVRQRAKGASRVAVTYAFMTWDGGYGPVVSKAYLRYLNRLPDAAEFGFWVGQMRTGLRQELLAAAFVASDEFYELVLDLATVTGTT